jgi:cell division protein FtsL
VEGGTKMTVHHFVFWIGVSLAILLFMVLVAEAASIIWDRFYLKRMITEERKKRKKNNHKILEEWDHGRKNNFG